MVKVQGFHDLRGNIYLIWTCLDDRGNPSGVGGEHELPGSWFEIEAEGRFREPGSNLHTRTEERKSLLNV